MNLPAAETAGHQTLMLSGVIPAEAGIQKNKIIWIPGQARNDGVP